MTKADRAREFRNKYGIEMPTRRLAEIMYKKHYKEFKDVEDARYALRRIEGKAKSGGTKITHPANQRPLNPYKLPESYAEKREPYKLPKACDNILLISDLHIPYHDIQAITIALDYGVQNKCNTIFINGDLIDFARISKFETDLSKRSVREEFDATKEFLRVLRATFPEAEIFWLKGNHCVRYEKYIMSKCHEIWDDPYYLLEERLRLNEERVKLIDDKVLVKAGKLSITHGHHIFKGIFSPVSPARGAYNKAKQSVIVGHLHRDSYHPEVDLDGNVVGCWSTACLCELRPNYSPLVSNSTHGFANILVEPNGNFHVKNFKIINGKLY